MSDGRAIRKGFGGGPRLSGNPDLRSPDDVIRAAAAADSGIVFDLRHHMRDGRDDAPPETTPGDSNTAVRLRDADEGVRPQVFSPGFDVGRGGRRRGAGRSGSDPGPLAIQYGDPQVPTAR
ncbi:hypothetical protein AB0G54_39650 [Streptomyces yokosukanensis]|uniref:hypothetical protein n=1 Tax=Streptomyces yokosukanensis TaxID=67386 RepID=UPI003412042E